MPKYNKLIGSVKNNRLFENMMIEVERNKANTDYIAMMNDIELPEFDVGTEGVES